MPEKLTYTKDITRYCTGRDFHDACQRIAQDDAWVRETAQEAYNSLGFWEEQEDGPWEVFEFRSVETITKVEPPYTTKK